MKEFFVTFGKKYADKPHPNFPEANPDGWVVIEADDIGAARAEASSRFGEYFAFMYSKHDFLPHLFPKGEIARFKSRYNKLTMESLLEAAAEIGQGVSPQTRATTEYACRKALAGRTKEEIIDLFDKSPDLILRRSSEHGTTGLAVLTGIVIDDMVETAFSQSWAPTAAEKQGEER